MYILGISAYYHDSAACLLRDGQILAAAQEERFSRKKHDARFPKNAIQYCLEEANITLKDIQYIAFYDKPFIKFERLLETYLAYAPHGFRSFLSAMPIWIKEKLFLKSALKKEFTQIGKCKSAELPPLMFAEHHQSHAASAFFPSPFEKAAVLCLDGVGEWATTSAWFGEKNTLTPLWEIDFPHSLGLLYSAFTYYTGFKVNSGEYKVMGLAPYGEPRYVDLIRQHLIDIKPDGTFRLNMDYFNYVTGLTMTNQKFHDLMGGPPRKPESLLTQKEMDLARSIQVITEEIMLKLSLTIHKETGLDYLCLAGGVALNCVANGRIVKESLFKKIWIQPAAGDAGGAIGSAFSIWYQYLRNTRSVNPHDSMQGSYLGPSFNAQTIRNHLKSIKAVYQEIPESKLCAQAAQLLSQENVIGWCQGRMEFGPRALGNRSIIGDARSPKMQSIMNLKIKYRESFRPFAPAIQYNRLSEWFDIQHESPYMLLVAPVQNSKRISISKEQNQLFGIEKLNIARSTIPAVTHVDYSARIQTVHPETNPRFYQLLDEFEKITQCPLLINTSFNVRGEPIVCSIEDAYRCFMRTEMDYLIIENFILSKKDQPHFVQDTSWQKEFILD